MFIVVGGGCQFVVIVVSCRRLSFGVIEALLSLESRLNLCPDIFKLRKH